MLATGSLTRAHRLTAAHKNSRLMLLGSPPDMVHSACRTGPAYPHDRIGTILSVSLFCRRALQVLQLVFNGGTFFKPPHIHCNIFPTGFYYRCSILSCCKGKFLPAAKRETLHRLLSYRSGISPAVCGKQHDKDHFSLLYPTFSDLTIVYLGKIRWAYPSITSKPMLQIRSARSARSNSMPQITS